MRYTIKFNDSTIDQIPFRSFESLISAIEIKETEPNRFRLERYSNQIYKILISPEKGKLLILNGTKKKELDFEFSNVGHLEYITKDFQNISVVTEIKPECYGITKIDEIINLIQVL
jgi:hypothetical protein